MIEGMKPIRTLIVDDEPLARKRLRSLLQTENGFRVLGEASDGLEALDAITAGGIDLIFLDVHMPRLDGLDMLDSLAGVDIPRVVFVTAFQEHAVRAFEANALDYLVKPFENERFYRTLHRIQLAFASGTPPAALTSLRPELGQYARRLAIRRSSMYELVDVGTIDRISTHRNYVRLHIAAETRLLRRTMNEIEARLDPRAFVRVHRSTIINISRISTIRPHRVTDFLITLVDGTEISSSRAYRGRIAALCK
jgi:two-component system, LytTR family, response regulator